MLSPLKASTPLLLRGGPHDEMQRPLCLHCACPGCRAMRCHPTGEASPWVSTQRNFLDSDPSAGAPQPHADEHQDPLGQCPSPRTSAGGQGGQREERASRNKPCCPGIRGGQSASAPASSPAAAQRSEKVVEVRPRRQFPCPRKPPPAAEPGRFLVHWAECENKASRFILSIFMEINGIEFLPSDSSGAGPPGSTGFPQLHPLQASCSPPG